MKPFSEFTEKDVQDYIRSNIKDEKEDFESNIKFLKGDHWQNGDGWGGSLPKNQNDRGNALKKIKSIFTSQNVIKEVVGRLIAAVIGKEPEWGITLTRTLAEDETPNSDEQTVIDETEQALNIWWGNNEIHTELEQWIRYVLSGSKAVLRIYIPSRFTESSIQPGDFSEQLAKIKVEAVDPTKGAVVTDEDASVSAGMLSYTITDAEGDDTDIYEISYLDDNDSTLTKNLVDDSQSDPLTLSGHLTIYQGGRDLFLTPQVRQQNMLINKAHTMMNNNLDSGFLERIFLNAEPPGHYETEDDGSQKFVRDPYEVGPGTTNFVNPPYAEDSTGNEKPLGSASVSFREPVENKTFAEAKDEAYSAILEEVHQKHALISGDAAPSGESRIQALADFIMDAQITKSTIDKAGKWLIETVMYLGFNFSNQESRVDQYKATFNCRIDPGQIPAELRTAIINQVDEGLLSRDTAMSMLGIDDVDAELALIDSAAQQAWDMLQKMRDANLDIPTLTKALVDIIVKDKQFISDVLSQEQLNSIDQEIDDQSIQNRQEQQLNSTLGIT